METEKIKVISIAVTIIFGGFIIIAFVVFSLFSGGNSNNNSVVTSKVEVWSTVPERNFLDILNFDKVAYNSIRNFLIYRYIPEDQFSEIFVNALAVGSGPDLVLLPQDIIALERDKLVLNRYGENTITRKDFFETFVASSGILDYGEGFLGLPIYTDPLVLFYNKDIQSVTKSQIPKFWRDINSKFINKVVSKDGVNIERSAIPLGTGTNVRYAKEILLSILFQNDYYQSEGGLVSSTVQSLSNYSNPTLSTYTWNNTLPESLQYFASNRSLLYIGYGSDKNLIEKINPSLNYGITGLPQSNSDKYITYNNMVVAAIPRTAKNYPGALSVMFTLISNSIQSSLNTTNYQSSLRSTILENSAEVVNTTLNEEVKYGISFFDENYIKTNSVINDSLDGLYSNRDSIQDVSFKIEEILR